MVALFTLGDYSEDGPALADMAQEIFTKKAPKGPPMYGSSAVSASDLERLYYRSREVLAASNVKLVAVVLGAATTQVGGVIVDDAFVARFMEKIEEYSLRNVEVCTSTQARFHGGFDDDY